jgi:CD109 antigen
MRAFAAAPGGVPPVAQPAAPAASAAREEGRAAGDQQAGEGLAEVQRVRQFFPETWLWSDLTTDAAGRGSQRLTAPDSITTWMFRAVALSKEKGLGIAEAQLKVFQPFFAQVDLPYAAVRGEELPAKVALYNYSPNSQDFTVEIEPADWFDLLEGRTKTVTVPANSVGAAAFAIRPTALGVRPLKVTARSRASADALVKELIVEPEGVQRELVENLVLSAGEPRTLDLAVPEAAVPGSARAFFALSGNVLSQTMEGLENLLQMSYGCGEQNMVLFAPNVFVSRYLKETGQLKVEVMAKAEKLMLTGYQRQLTYRRSDNSFSAFGQSDKQGSLWLTSFVLKTFAQARDLVYIDDQVLTTAGEWIRKHQAADGSFEPVGFVHHQELMGGLSGKTALTAFVAVALREAGDDATAARAERYLEDRLGATDDPYALALSAYALTLAKSGRARAARDKLLGLARESDQGLSWEGPPPAASATPIRSGPRRPDRSAAIETTAYAALALLAAGEAVPAGRAVRWLAAQRNAKGGFGSTQDTIVALQALTAAAGGSRSEVDATVTLSSGAWRKEVGIRPDNADVLQIIEAPAGGPLSVTTRGKGQITAQAVRRFNLLAAEGPATSAFRIDVRYSADQIAVNDLIDVTATVRFTPPEPIAAGMVVLDVAIPTGFAAEADTVEALAKREPKLKRWDLAGRKVILYIEDLRPDEEIALGFKARALYPVRAQPVGSQVYAYYRPEWKGESLGGALTVGAKK